MTKEQQSAAPIKHAIKTLSGAVLFEAEIPGDTPSGLVVRHALEQATQKRADLSGADLSGANLSGADLSGVQGLLDTIDFLAQFARDEHGLLVYKTFGAYQRPPANWQIAPGSVITETVNFDRASDCGSGINIATLNWVNLHGMALDHPIWLCRIRNEWLPGVVVPLHTDGKFRCSRLELLYLVDSTGKPLATEAEASGTAKKPARAKKTATA